MKSPTKSSTVRVATRRAAPPSMWKASPVAAACVAALWAGVPAQAQTGAVAAPGSAVITITGIRRGIESAINVKKNADSIVEAISAEDLGKLPDTSIAESISRLPGVAAQRTAGRASQISLRGMAPDFSTSLLNGREQASTGDSRSAEFDQYPSELLSGVIIHKTPEADLVGQGLSGTINLQTVRPLDFAQRTVALAYRKNKLNVGGGGKEGSGSRFSVMYVDQFADRTIGVALGFARLDEEGGITTRFDSWGGGTARLNGAGPDLNVPYNGFGAFADQETRKRDGLAATIQFRPNKNFASTLDVFQSKFDKVKTTTGFQAPLNDSWNGNPGDYDSGGVLTAATGSPDVQSGTFNRVRGVVRNDSESTKDKMSSVGWNNRFKLGEDWTFNADIAQSTAKRTGGIIETTAGTVQSALRTAQLDSIQFTRSGNFTPGLNYADRNIIKLTDVQGWGGGIGSPQAGYSKLPFVEDTIKGFRLSAKRDLALGPLVDVEAGVHLSDREKERSFTEGRLVIAGQGPLGSTNIPGGGVTAISLPGGGSISVASFDSSSSVGSVYDVVKKLNPDIYNKDWRLEEKVNTFFVKSSLDTALFGVATRGNVGVQLVQTDQSSTAFNVDRSPTVCQNDQVCPATERTVGTTYTDVLPSLNLAADFGNAGTVRFALARVMARPKVDDMRASFGFGLNNNENVLDGSGGNPTLKPFRANAIDVSYEKYFGGNQAYISVAAFYKDLASYIVNVTNPSFNFAPFTTPSTVLPIRPNPTVGRFTQPVNGSGGSIQGTELSASFPLNMVLDMLDGFGFFASQSNTTSSLDLTTASVVTDGVNTGKIPLPGLSKKVTNYVIYFEKWGFSARVATRKRSDFVGEVADFAGDRRLTYIKGESITDVQVGYELQSGPLKGLAVRAEISNTGNTPFIRYRDTYSNEIENRKDGKFYQVGVNYRF